MATSSSVVNYEVTLTLSSLEAQWLQGYLQNRRSPNPLDETSQDAEMRRSLFEALKAANDGFKHFQLKDRL